LISEATTMGRRIAMYAQRDPDDPVAAITGVVKAREKAAGGSAVVSRAKAATVSEMREEVVKAAPSASEMIDFFDFLKCEGE
jgi:hypothetical protein